eukprot:9389497-Alexandrium_andersonii.AAC.1
MSASLVGSEMCIRDRPNDWLARRSFESVNWRDQRPSSGNTELSHLILNLSLIHIYAADDM